jgi:hypothetical protein
MKRTVLIFLTAIFLLALLQGCATSNAYWKILAARPGSPVGTDGILQGIVESEVECLGLSDQLLASGRGYCPCSKDVI